ncbi:MAG: DUF2264 domain-containing protein [Rikenellaceae bacterium]
MKKIIFALVALVAIISCSQNSVDKRSDREKWVDMMCFIVDPVLRNTAAGTLRENMPFESIDQADMRRECSYLEAVARTLCGIAPWLEQSEGEEDIKEEYRALARASISNAVNPESPDFMCEVTSDKRQLLVDAAYLAEAILRAPNQLWRELDIQTQANVITLFEGVRQIKPGENNWLLFASIVEAALLETTGECDMERMLYGVNRFKNDFYKGDGVYGDGVNFHMDYYNSYVIHPMLLDVLMVMEQRGIEGYEFIEQERIRHTRYSEILERHIASDGTYPIVGRTIAACRCGAFHSLSQGALLDLLPQSITPGQARSALTAVIMRQFEDPNNFDEDGWMKIGISGSQIEMSEDYVNTGSLYHSTTIFVALGLPSSHPFWSDDAKDWTNKRAWSGAQIPRDKYLKE